MSATGMLASIWRQISAMEAQQGPTTMPPPTEPFASCEGYPAWNNRDLLYITNNQAGTIIINVVENNVDAHV